MLSITQKYHFCSVRLHPVRLWKMVCNERRQDKYSFHNNITDSKNFCLLDYPEIMRCLVRPLSFEPRTLNFFVKEEYKEIFPKIFNKYFGDSFVLLTKDEALSERLFGTGNNRAGLEDMIGDYIALAISDKSIFITHFEAQEMPGVHAGLTEAERKIPFIVIEKK